MPERVPTWGDENYASIGCLFVGKSRSVFIPIGQAPKADFSIVSRPREKRRIAFAADTKTEKMGSIEGGRINERFITPGLAYADLPPVRRSGPEHPHVSTVAQ